MNHYKYLDNSKYPSTTILFECNAVDILEAHKKFEHGKGINPVKYPWIGCQIEFNIENIEHMA